MFGERRLKALEQWVDRHDELLSLAAKAVPYIPPESTRPASSAVRQEGRQAPLPYERAADIISALSSHVRTLKNEIAPPLAEDLRRMTQDITLMSGHGDKGRAAAGGEDLSDDRWVAILKDMSFRSLVDGAAAGPSHSSFGRLRSFDEDVELHHRRSRRGRRADMEDSKSAVHPTLQRLLRMTPEELEARRAELELERQVLNGELVEAPAGGEEDSQASPTPAGTAASPTNSSASPKQQRSPSAMFQSVVGKTAAAFRFMKKDSISAEAKKKPAPFPYAFEVVPTCTFLRKLTKTLHEGSGSTVVAVDFTSGYPIVRSILEEAEDPYVGMSDFAKAMTKDGLRALVSIREAKPLGSTEASWRKEAEHKQFQRHFRGSAVLTKRNSESIKERLSFAADRPKGLLETMAADFAPVVACTFSDSIAPPGGPPFSLFYPRSGMQVVYFSTRSDANSFVTISVSPWLLCPESYAMCSVHPMYGGCVPQNWILEGSNDGGHTFTPLKQHTNDDSFLRGSDFAVFDIPPITYVNPVTKEQTTRRFIGSMFRIRCTGENALGSLNLQVAAVEFYGRAMTCLEVPPIQEASRPTPASFFGDSISKTLTYGIPKRGSAVVGMAKGFRALPPHPPDAPIGGKPKKKK